MNTEIPELAYIFNLHLVCGGQVYFSSYSEWVKYGESKRDIRQPSSINTQSMTEALTAIGQSVVYVEDNYAFEHWLLRRGWAFVEKKFAKDEMKYWLKQRECLTSPFGSFTDLRMASIDAKRRSPMSYQKEKIRERDAGICLLCGKTHTDENPLTMHHIRPASKGGETTSSNLMLLCRKCNQGIGNEHRMDLYDLARLPHSIDWSLLKEELNDTSFMWLSTISKNLMYSRCSIL